MTTSYSIHRKIGEGGMGVVFLAMQHPLEREVAIKFLPPDLTDTMRIERFEREVEAAMRLHHPNIIKILDKGNQDGKYYYVMEYLDGYSTLHDYIQRRGRLPWKEAVEILVQVLNALECCHEQELLHRDIKPRNIMVSETRPVKVMDFGLVKLLDAEALTQEGKSMGTPSYMAPERFLSKPETATIDLFSAGAVLYEMLSGQRAFPGESAREVVPRIMKEATPRLAAVDPSLEAYQPILETFLAKYSEERFATARAARDALERRLISGAVAMFPPRKARRTELAPVAAAPKRTAQPVDPERETRRHRRRQRRRTVTKVMAACVAASLALLVAHLFRRSAPSSMPAPPLELTVVPGADRARISMTTALAEPVEIEVTSDKDARGVRHSLRDELLVTGLAEDTRYHWKVSRTGGSGGASGHFHTRSVLEAGRELTASLEEAQIPALLERIRLRKVELAPGGRMSDWSKLREESAQWVQQAMIRSRLPPIAETFSPVRDAFFGGTLDPEEKRRLYIALQPLASLELDAAHYEIALTPLAATLLSPAWDRRDPGTTVGAPGIAIVWGDGAAFAKDRARFDPDLSVLATRQAPPRFHSDRRTLRTDPGDFNDDMHLVEAEMRGDIPYESPSMIEFPGSDSRSGLVVAAFDEATGGNVLELQIAGETGPFSSFVLLRPRDRDFHRVGHSFDARLLAGRKLRLRCRFQIDHHAPGFSQHPRIHYVAILFPPGS